MKSSRRALIVLLIVSLGGCAEPPAEDAVATWKGGHLMLADVEAVLLEPEGETQTLDAGSSARGAEEWLQSYRRAARQLALKSILLAELDDSPGQLIEELGEEYAKAERDALIDLYLERQIQVETEIEPSEVEKFYDENQELFRRSARRFVWHIFRRTRDGETTESTLEFLAGLKERAETGEIFKALAREYSDSETRLLDGRLGWVGQGRLSESLEELVFALPIGQISEPVAGGGGGALFLVSDAIAERLFELEDVRLVIHRALVADKLREAVAEVVADIEPPEEAEVLEENAWDGLMEAPPDEVVLDIGSARLTAGALRALAIELTDGQEIALREPSQILRDIYQEQLHRQLLFIRAVSEGFPSEASEVEELSESVRSRMAERWVDLELQDRMRRAVTDHPTELRSFYDNNRFLFQSSLRFKIQTLFVPLADASPAKVETFHSLRSRLMSGQHDFDKAAVEVGAMVEDLGWISAEELAAMEPKVRFYLLDLDGPGYSIPFQLNQRLQILWVEAREEPRELPFEEVEDQVIAAYLARTQQKLYRDVADDVLGGRDFEFFEDKVRDVLQSAPSGVAPQP